MSNEIQVIQVTSLADHHDSAANLRRRGIENNGITPRQNKLFHCIGMILSGIPYIGSYCQRQKEKAMEWGSRPSMQQQGQDNGEVPITMQSAGQQQQPQPQPRENLLGRIPVKVKKEQWQRTLHVLEPSRVLVYLLVILAMSLSIPKLRDRAFLDLAPLWQWVLFGIMILGGNTVTYLLGKSLVAFLAWYYEGSKRAKYYIEGLEQAIHFALFSALFLLTNLIYFANTDINHHINKRPQYKGTPLYVIFTRYVIATSLAAVIASLLSLVKTYLLLKLKAAQVYRRLEHKIERMMEPVWFLAIINEQYSDEDLQYLRKILVPSNGCFDRTYWKAKYFMNISKTFKSRDEDKITQKFLHKSDRKMEHLGDTDHMEPKHLMNFGMSTEDAERLFFMVWESSPPSSSSPSLVTYATFKKWLVKTYRECLQLGHTLCDCRAAVQQLDRVFIVVTIYLVGAWWLIMTHNGSTKVLGIIAFPITVAAFIFQDTCRNMFEGIVFTFFKQPFDVGDMCIIDGDQLEVKRLGIGMTVFYKEEAKAQVKIPNSILATKSITNLKSMPDAFDHLELNLDASTTYENIEILKKKIESEINIYRSEGSQGPITDEGNLVEVIIKEMDASIKLFVYFKHHITTDYDMEYSKFFWTKNKRRSHLLLQVKGLLDQLKINLVAQPPRNP